MQSKPSYINNYSSTVVFDWLAQCSVSNEFARQYSLTSGCFYFDAIPVRPVIVYHCSVSTGDCMSIFRHLCMRASNESSEFCNESDIAMCLTRLVCEISAMFYVHMPYLAFLIGQI